MSNGIIEIGDLKITQFTLIDEELIKKLFSILCESKEKINEIEFISFLKNLQSSFQFQTQIFETIYKNEKEALISYRAERIDQATNLIEKIGKKYGGAELSFYSFQNALLEYLIYADSNRTLILDASISFHQLTLKEESIFKRNHIKNPIREKVSNKFLEETSPVITLPEWKIDINFELPNQKGLRFTIFSLILSHFSAKELMKFGLVSKECLSISRQDFLWKKLFIKEFKTNLKERYPYVERNLETQMFPPPLVSLNEKIRHELERYEPSEISPWFLEYWLLHDQIIEIVANHSKPQAPRRCGITVEPRQNQQDFSLIVDQPSLSSEELVVGCCHDSVNRNADRLFSSERFSSLCELKMHQKESQIWKKKLTQQVSLECMENALEEREIRMRISRLIQNKFFGL